MGKIMDMSKNSDKLCGSIACRPTDDMDIHLCLHSGPDSVAESRIPLVALDETLHECQFHLPFTGMFLPAASG